MLYRGKFNRPCHTHPLCEPTCQTQYIGIVGYASSNEPSSTRSTKICNLLDVSSETNAAIPRLYTNDRFPLFWATVFRIPAQPQHCVTYLSTIYPSKITQLHKQNVIPVEYKSQINAVIVYWTPQSTPTLNKFNNRLKNFPIYKAARVVIQSSTRTGNKNNRRKTELNIQFLLQLSFLLHTKHRGTDCVQTVFVTAQFILLIHAKTCAWETRRSLATDFCSIILRTYFHHYNSQLVLSSEECTCRKPSSANLVSLVHWVTLTFAERFRLVFSLSGFANLSTKITTKREFRLSSAERKHLAIPLSESN